MVTLTLRETTAALFRVGEDVADRVGDSDFLKWQ
jgi:hypothetical protein